MRTKVLIENTFSQIFCVYNWKQNFQEGGGVKQVEMLYRCNYVGIVSGGQSPKYSKNKGDCQIYLIKTNFNQNYSNLVSNCLGRLPEKSGHHTRVQHGSACNQTAPRSVRLFASCLNWISVWIMSRFDRIAIVFEKLLKVYTFSQTPQLLHVFETYTNPAALCCLCSHSANSNLAYMGKKSGQVVLIDLANTEKSPVEIVAHEAPVSCMALSHDGSKLATSSIKVNQSI